MQMINGVIVFDGSIVPPIKGLLKEPVRLLIQNGNVEKIEGGKEAVDYETWLRNFNHPRMLKLAHVCYGFNPGARLSGNILEDERVWGSTEWGLGQVGSMSIPGGISAPSHTDGICLDSSVWLDGNQILDRGKVVDPELITLAAKLGKG
jgi:2,5-dihydroxypyridine 5,6-dioxygenase